MRKSILTIAALVGVLVMSPSAVLGDGDPSSTASMPGLKFETLLKAVLGGIDSTEVIVSRVTIPPHTSLPKHWHPGEEFAYVLEGSVTLWQKGKDDIVGKPGDVVKVALNQVHTAITNDESATVLVFRVHKQGEPERVPVEDN
jgi:quercetin dioxygenase-like cupin family protein